MILIKRTLGLGEIIENTQLFTIFYFLISY